MRTLFNFLVAIAVFSLMLAILRTSTTPSSPQFLDITARDYTFIEEIRRIEEHFNKTMASLSEKLSSLGAEISKDSPSRREMEATSTLPTIYVITPTFKRYEQIPELTRLGQTLLNVRKTHWIVADDTNITNEAVVKRLESLGIPFTYLLTPMPMEYHSPKIKAKPKGVSNRNGGIDWLRNHATEGVIYMADDDNTYDIRIFEEIRYTMKVSMFPVGFTTSYGLSTPILKEGKFVGWYDGWIANRKYPVDMAGFAVSVPFLLTRPKAKMPYVAGYEETGLLSSLDITPDDVEFLADNCTKIYVWHTKTMKNQPSSKDILKVKYNGTNLRELQKVMMIKKH